MIAAYLRESTDKQDIGTQRKLLREHCTRNNVEYNEFADDDVSGAVPFRLRPQSRRLLEAAKQGKLSEVIVYRFDRLGRDHADTYLAIGELLKNNVKVTSLKEGIAENTASGRLKTGVHTLFAQYEKDSIVERSIDATLRLAKEGVWLGGIVPFGYRQVGVDQAARLEISTDPIPGLKWSEADVIRRIFEKSAKGESCRIIADYLNHLGIPPAYSSAKREVTQGKRKQRTTGIWRASRIRNTIVNHTYAGTHEWGKRRMVRDDDGRTHLKAVPQEEWIQRPCPAIVSEELWRQANTAMHKNQIVAMAHAKNDYLLRGLIRCGLCGLTYCGAAVARKGMKEFYYRCNGNAAARGIYGAKGERCPNPSVRGVELESQVWAHIESFLRQPGLAAKELQAKMTAEGDRSRKVADEIRELEAALSRKRNERINVLREVGRGNFQEAEIKSVLGEIDSGITGIESELASLREVSTEAETIQFELDWAGRWLGEQGKKKDLTFAEKRALVEALIVEPIIIPADGTGIHVKYRFASPLDRARAWGRNQSLALDDTGRRIWQRLTLEKVIVFPGKRRSPVRPAAAKAVRLA